MFKNLIEIIKRLFKVSPVTTDAQQKANEKHSSDYRDASKISNPTAIAAMKIANLVLFDSAIDIESESGEKLADPLNQWLEAFTGNDLYSAVTEMLGTGGAVLRPYIDWMTQSVGVDLINQEAFTIIQKYGKSIIEASVVIDTFVRESKTYVLTEYHKITPDKTYIIKIKGEIGGKEVALSAVPAWANYKPEQTYRNIDTIFITYLKYPDSRWYGELYGLPVTYGNSILISHIQELQLTLIKEFRLKKPRLGGNQFLFESDQSGNVLMQDDQLAELFVTFKTDDQDRKWFEIFAPPYQEQAVLHALAYFERELENSIGVNQGILTDMDTANATATAIQRSNKDTLSLVARIRKTIESAVNSLADAIYVIALTENMVPKGEYSVVFDWSYALVEDSAERWAQLKDGVAMGITHGHEARAWSHDLTLEEAQETMPDTVEEEDEGEGLSGSGEEGEAPPSIEEGDAEIDSMLAELEELGKGL